MQAGLVSKRLSWRHIFTSSAVTVRLVVTRVIPFLSRSVEQEVLLAA